MEEASFRLRTHFGHVLDTCLHPPADILLPSYPLPLLPSPDLYLQGAWGGGEELPPPSCYQSQVKMKKK